MGFGANLSDSGVSSAGSQVDLSIFLDEAQYHDNDSCVTSLEVRSDRAFSCMHTNGAEKPDIGLMSEDDDAIGECYVSPTPHEG